MIEQQTNIENAIPLRLVSETRLAAWLERCDERTRNWLQTTGFAAKPGSYAIVPDAHGAMAEVVVGVAEPTDLYALSALPFALPSKSGERYFVATPAEGESALPANWAALGWMLGSYRFDRYKSGTGKPATLIMAPGTDVETALQTFEAIKLVRDLVNTPTEDMGPQHLADCAQTLAEEFGATIRQWIGEELLVARFPAIHAVGRASHRPPRLIELTWGQAAHPLIAIVGKGVCFDTGGLNMKGADGMRWMKKDMGGAAHALALARLVMQAKLPVRLQLLVPAVENAIAANAYRPGEVVASRKGDTIEIGNTDAEGRVILADALTYAAESKPALIVDFATLTGAARVALGPELPATFCNDDEWFQRLSKASTTEQDPLWRMPLWPSYKSMLDSSIATLNNSGGQHAGAITAALFLQHFLPVSQKWIHLDVFAWNPKSKPGRPEGGEAQSLRAVFAMLKHGPLLGE